LSRDYSGLFSDLIDFARKMVLPDRSSRRRRRVQYWTALALLRGIMSSPDAGIKMLNARRDKLNSAAQESDLVEPFEDLDVSVDNPVRDLDYGFESDNAPTHVVEQSEWTDNERRQLRQFAERLEVLANIQDDQKLFAAAILLEEWIEKGFRPVVFCRYIETAKYLGKHLEPALRRKYPKLDLRAGSQGLPFVRS